MVSKVSLLGGTSLKSGSTGLVGAHVSVSPGTAALKTTGVVILGGLDAPFPELFIVSIPTTAAHSSTVPVTLTWTAKNPTGFTGAWNPGNVSSTVTLFSFGVGTAQATFSTPSTPGTYKLTITGTGPNTAVVISANVVIT